MVRPNTSGRTIGIFYNLMSWGFARILGVKFKTSCIQAQSFCGFPANRWRNEFIISNVYLSTHVVYLRDRHGLIVSIESRQVTILGEFIIDR